MNSTRLRIAPSPGLRARFPTSGDIEVTVSTALGSVADEVSEVEEELREIVLTVVGAFFAVILVLVGAVAVAFVTRAALVKERGPLVARVAGREVPFVEVGDGGGGLVGAREVAFRPGVVDRVTLGETD